MADRRNGKRKAMAMTVTQRVGGASRSCVAEDLSPTGIRMGRSDALGAEQTLCIMELHLVPGAVSTAVTARRVRRDDRFEAFEFVCPSFAQQAMLERLLDNY